MLRCIASAAEDSTAVGKASRAMAIGFAAVEFGSHTEKQIASDEPNHNPPSPGMRT